MGQKKTFLERVLGAWGREAVRFGFTVFAIYAFYEYGDTVKQGCDSTIFKIKTNSNQIFSALVVVSIGLGSALVMKLAELKLKKS